MIFRRTRTWALAISAGFLGMATVSCSRTLSPGSQNDLVQKSEDNQTPSNPEIEAKPSNPGIETKPSDPEIGTKPSNHALNKAKVTLQETGNSIILDNGIIKVTLDKPSSKVLSMKYQGLEVLMQNNRHSGAYYSWNGATGFGQPGNFAYSVKKQNDDLVDVSFKSTYTGTGMPMDIDIHYALRSGESELYLYNTIEHQSSYPQMDLGEHRVLFWLAADPADNNEWLFEKFYHGDGVRDFKLPSRFDYSHAVPTPIGEILKLTTGIRAGLYDSKYSWSTRLWDHPAIGNASDKNKKGIFAIFPSQEYFNQGPMYHDLVNGPDVIHIYMNGDHYDGASIVVPVGEHFKKTFGPFSIYLNSKATADEAFKDAKLHQAEEAKAWPFAWLNYESDYPIAAARGRAKGTFKIKDPAKPELNGGNAWIGLTIISDNTRDQDFMYESRNYQHWVKTAADGSFTLPNIRPGTYKLFAYADGAVGQFEKEQIVIAAGVENNLGTLTWNIPRTDGRLVWEIGVNNRSSSEFKNGSDKYWYGFTDELIPGNYKNPLEYDVSRKNWGTTLNYAQVDYPNADGTKSLWRWNLNFNLAQLPAKGDATLTIAYASAGGASQGVYVNSSKQLTRFFPPAGRGNAFTRQSNYGKYSFYKVKIPVNQLKIGRNTIGLEISKGGHVMYDSISLEIPDSLSR